MTLDQINALKDKEIFKVSGYECIAHKYNHVNFRGSETFSFKMTSINGMTDDPVFGGAFIEHMTECDAVMVEAAVEAAAEKMREVEKWRDGKAIIMLFNEPYSDPMVFKKKVVSMTGQEELDPRTKKKYEYQLNTDDMFSVFTVTHGEADCPIHRNLNIHGTLFVPSYSFWLDRPVYHFPEQLKHFLKGGK